ncbi:MAG TPA: D-alanyl-D-alanine carboxypeptidase/D-alanyl-D-alanine-endopeptidase [Gaiellaceae bacterium]|nr:D-alanyl-D-alanine carboxypeptidase/D-alanyl-D-alanine-endopeptidase [Gaiellaceae bacterium]
MRRLGLVACLLLVLAPCALAAARLPLTVRLANALAVPGAPARSSGAVAIDLLTGKTLFARNADLSLAPASNEKLLVTYGALVALGPTYRFRTEVLGSGRLSGGVWHGDLVLKGFGDPTLTSAGLKRLVVQLKRRGIERVTGRVVGDESWFDGVRTAPGWKPSFYLWESPPLSALVVNGDVYEKHLALRPAVAAAGVFRKLLRLAGIPAGRVVVGRADARATVLAVNESRPLSGIVRDMDLSSDNFTAELLVKEIGAEAGEGGTTAGGLAVVMRDLGAAGVPLQGVRMADGSGLSLDDRVTARALSALLLAIWRNPQIRDVVWRALPVAGVSGTLQDRLDRRPTRGAVRAKTGTTDLATALSGYVRRQYAFAVLDNGYPVSFAASREAQDRFVTALAATP